MYLPSLKTLNVYGGYIYGPLGAVGVKTGTVNVYGGSLVCDGEDATPTEGWSSGMNDSGAAIQIESNEGYQVNDLTNVVINIEGGTIASTNGYAIYEYTNNGDASYLDSVKISGGIFSSAKGVLITSEKYSLKDATAISGGNYNDDSAAAFLVEGYIIHKAADGTYDVHKTPVAVDAIEATNTADGNIAYFACPDCEVVFSDGEGVNVIEKSEVVIPALVQVADNKATVSEDAVSNAINDTKKGDQSAKLDLTESGDNIEAAEISVDSLKALVDENLGLTLVTTNGNITLDKVAIESILDTISKDDSLADAKTVTLAVKMIEKEALTEAQLKALDGVDVKNLITLEVIVDGKVIASKDLGGFGKGIALVEIPFTAQEGEDGSDYSLFYIDENGNILKINSEYKDGYMTAELSHFSTYFIAKSDAINGVKTETPKTGDSTNLMMLLSLLAVSGGATAVVANRKRRNSSK